MKSKALVHTQPIDINARRQPSLMAIFDEETLGATCRRVCRGLRMPPDSGEYKYAHHQLQRLWSFASALLVPVLMLMLLTLLVQPPETAPITRAASIRPTPAPPLPPPEPPRITPPEPQFVVDEMPMQLANFTTHRDLAPPAPQTPKPTAINAVADIRSPVTLTGVFSTPDPGRIGKTIDSGEGTTRGEDAVMRALRWLARTQRSDGSWEGTSAPAMTALSLLAFLGHDETTESLEFGETVLRGLSYLIAAEKDGKISGSDGHEYAVPICAYALCEATAKIGHPELHVAAERLVTRIVAGQSLEGGFGYNLKQGSPASQDLSYAGWCMQALKTAQLGNIGNTDDVKHALKQSLAGCQRWFRQADSTQGTGTFSYRMTGGGGHNGLTAVGVLCMQLLGGASLPECQAGFSWLTQKMPYQWGQLGPSKYSQVYYHYYATQAFFQYGGAPWKAWDTAMQATLPEVQTVSPVESSGYCDHTGEPRAIGHWNAKEVGERHTGGTVMDTALNTLMLEVYYRQLGSFKVLGGTATEAGSDTLESNKDITIRITNHRSA